MFYQPPLLLFQNKVYCFSITLVQVRESLALLACKYTRSISANLLGSDLKALTEQIGTIWLQKNIFSL